MNLNNVLTILKNDLDKIGEVLLLTKEPDENAADIDLFITNRAKKTALHLIKKPPVPLYFTHKTRGFAYYLSQSGFIKPIDLYDAPFITDASIAWFASRARGSDFNPDIKILSKEDQAAHLIYKALKKTKPKAARYDKIVNLTKEIGPKSLQDAFLALCKCQNDNEMFVKRTVEIVPFLYAKDASFERFSEITYIEPTAHTLIKRIINRLKRERDRLRQACFVRRYRQISMPLVCMVGVDGAGKSTTIRELGTSLNKIDFCNTRLETKTHYHIVTKLYMNQIKRILEFAAVRAGKIKSEKLQNMIESFILRTSLHCIFFDTRQKIAHFLKAAQKGRLVIIDRWWSDLFVAKNQTRFLEISPRLLTRFLSLARPTLFVLMEVPVEVSMQRRPDENQGRLSQKKEILAAFMQQHFEQDMLRLKGDDKIKENIKQIHLRLFEKWYGSVVKDKGMAVW